MKKSLPLSFACLTLSAFTANADVHGIDQDTSSFLKDFNKQGSETSVTTISRHGSFRLDMSPDEALPLFTAPGETLWIPSWKPVILNGDGFEQGTIFLTESEKGTTYWYVSEYNSNSHQACYIRVTPEHDIGTVKVAIEADGNTGSLVQVNYQMTSLSEEGKANFVGDFSIENYEKMMKEWQSMIVKSKRNIEAHQK